MVEVGVGAAVAVGTGVGVGVETKVDVGAAPVSQAARSNTRDQAAGKTNLRNLMETETSLRSVSNDRVAHLPRKGSIKLPRTRR